MSVADLPIVGPDGGLDQCNEPLIPETSEVGGGLADLLGAQPTLVFR